MLSPASPPGPALGPALREGLKLGPGPSPTFKARARPGPVFLGPDPSLPRTKNLKSGYFKNNTSEKTNKNHHIKIITKLSSPF